MLPPLACVHTYVHTNSSLLYPPFLVVVCGAAGGIGQPLSLLLKQSDLITHLALYDIVNAPGVAADLSHINTPSRVTGHGKDSLAEALKDAHTVVIPAGVPRKPGMTRDDLFKVEFCSLLVVITKSFSFRIQVNKSREGKNARRVFVVVVVLT